jgi:acyl carrier protein
MSLENEIIKMIAGILRIREEQLTMQSRMEDFAEWDSMCNVIIISSLEERYNIIFQDDVLFELTSIDSIVKEVANLI